MNEESRKSFDDSALPLHRVTVKVYRCTVCNENVSISTNHYGSCFNYCPGCSWKPSFGPGTLFNGRTYRKFEFHQEAP
jgi:hypothetical protein